MKKKLINGILVDTLSSLAIACITEKEHIDVARHIKRVLESFGIDVSPFREPFKLVSGKNIIIFRLPKNELNMVISNYSEDCKESILEYWESMKSGNPKKPNTLSEFNELYNKVSKVAWG